MIGNCLGHVSIWNLNNTKPVKTEMSIRKRKLQDLWGFLVFEEPCRWDTAKNRMLRCMSVCQLKKIHLQTHILVQRFRPSHKKCLNHAEPTYCEVAHQCKGRKQGRRAETEPYESRGRSSEPAPPTDEGATSLLIQWSLAPCLLISPP